MNIAEYNKFYKDNKRSLFNFIFKMTHDVEASEELVDDAFMKVYQKLETFDESKTSFKTWVYNIASNATVDYLRRKRLQTKSMFETHENNDGEEHIGMQFADMESADPLDQLITKESTQHIANVIKTLPQKHAEIISQYALGYTYDDIAEELNLPIGTVKGSIHLARIKMKEYFNTTELSKQKQQLMKLRETADNKVISQQIDLITQMQDAAIGSGIPYHVVYPSLNVIVSTKFKVLNLN